MPPPFLIKRYETYGLILAHLCETCINDGKICIALFSPLHYYYDKLLQQTRMDISKPIVWTYSGWYRKPSLMNSLTQYTKKRAGMDKKRIEKDEV